MNLVILIMAVVVSVLSTRALLQNIENGGSKLDTIFACVSGAYAIVLMIIHAGLVINGGIS